MKLLAMRFTSARSAPYRKLYDASEAMDLF